MSKLFTRKGLLVQAILYLISRGIFSWVQSEMTAKQPPVTDSGAIMQTDTPAVAPETLDYQGFGTTGDTAAGVSDAKQIIDLVNGK